MFALGEFRFKRGMNWRVGSRNEFPLFFRATHDSAPEKDVSSRRRIEVASPRKAEAEVECVVGVKSNLFQTDSPKKISIRLQTEAKMIST